MFTGRAPLPLPFVPQEFTKQVSTLEPLLRDERDQLVAELATVKARVGRGLPLSREAVFVAHCTAALIFARAPLHALASDSIRRVPPARPRRQAELAKTQGQLSSALQRQPPAGPSGAAGPSAAAGDRAEWERTAAMLAAAEKALADSLAERDQLRGELEAARALSAAVAGPRRALLWKPPRFPFLSPEPPRQAPD